MAFRPQPRSGSVASAQEAPMAAAAAPASWIIQLIQSSQGNLTTGYLPYGVGLLQAYVMRHARDLRRYTFLPLRHERLPVDQVWSQIQLADVYGFSTYIWNIEYSLALARQIKQRKPQALIIFGGPQVPDAAEDFLRQYPFIDVCVHGEGERVFLQLLESLPDCDWSGIPGISWLDPQGVFFYHPPGPRIVDLDEIPSPYLMGLFDPLLNRPDLSWIVLWETNRGCPFTCTFCDWGSAVASKVRRYSLERIKREIDWFAHRRVEVLSLCDANFGILKRDLEITRYVVETYQKTGFPGRFCMQNAKNVADRSYQIHQTLIEAGLGGVVTLSLQSLSPQVLTSIRRENISLETYRQLQERFSRAGVATYSDLLIGLPGETYDSFVDGVCRVIAEGQHDWISFYNVFVLPNAELAQPAYRVQHGIETVMIPYSVPWVQIYQEVPEQLEMVIATRTLAREDWFRIRCFAWWVMILHYNFKLLQLPLLTLHKVAGLPWRTLFEFFAEARFQHLPMLQDIHRFLRSKAEGLAQGQTLHCAMTQGGETRWLDVEDFLITGLKSPAIAQAFFAEVTLALEQLLQQTQAELPPGLLNEALQLSQALFLFPELKRPFALSGRYNLWECYQHWIRSEAFELQRSPRRYVRDWHHGSPFDVRVDITPLRMAR